MKIAIIGAGAMGSLFGARLAPLADVWLISRWTAHITAIQRSGLHLIGLDGAEATIPMQATTQAEQVGQDVDLAIIAVKSPATAQASHLAATLLKATGLALSMQNGLGNLETMAAVLGEDRVVQGVTSHGATLVEPGQVRHAGVGATHLAIRPEIASQVRAISTLFEQAGFETHLSPDLDSLLWGKLIINVGINALTAILRVPTGVLADVGPASRLVAAAVDEAVRVAQARQISLPYADPQAQVQHVIQATSPNRSSMLSDVLRAVPTEIEVINGAIVREGQRLGLDTPVNQVLVWLVKAIEESCAVRL